MPTKHHKVNMRLPIEYFHYSTGTEAFQFADKCSNQALALGILVTVTGNELVTVGLDGTRSNASNIWICNDSFFWLATSPSAMKPVTVQIHDLSNATRQGTLWVERDDSLCLKGGMTCYTLVSSMGHMVQLHSGLFEKSGKDLELLTGIFAARSFGVASQENHHLISLETSDKSIRSSLATFDTTPL